jgi:hypothetical protein
LLVEVAAGKESANDGIKHGEDLMAGPTLEDFLGPELAKTLK